MSVPQTVNDVCFYLPSFAGGGAERIFVRLANHMVGRGMSVHFIVNHDGGPMKALLSERVTLHVLGKRSSARAVPDLVAALKTMRPATLIAALTKANLAALLAARLAGGATRVVVCERNQFSAMRQREGIVRRTLITWAARLLYPRAHAVIGNTDEVTRDIARMAGLEEGRIGVIHNPAPDLDQIVAARAAPAPHPWLGGAQPTAIAIGRLVPQKDYPTMLQALARSVPELRLLVLGDGPLQSELEAMAQDLGLSDRVAFLGFQMNRFDYLVRADVFLLSSKTEGFPNALIEAVAAGVPAISTDCAGGGAREILGRDFPDRISPVGDANAMAQIIGTVLDLRGSERASDDRRRIAAIAERYHIDAVADAFLRRAAP